MLQLGLGFDGDRITIPIRDETGRLIGLLRYQPWAERRVAKMLAAPGSRRGLVPHPGIETSRQVLLVEGEPDMIAARSVGLPAIAVPGAGGWQSGWPPLLADRAVAVVMDGDEAGRRAAAAIMSDLSATCDARALDLAPERADGFDLSDWLMGGAPGGGAGMAALSSQILTVEEAAAVARCSIKTVRRAYTNEALTAYRRGGSRAVVVERQDALAWVHAEMLQGQTPMPRSSAARSPAPGRGRPRPAEASMGAGTRAQRLGDQVRFDLSAAGLRARRRATSQSDEVS